MAFGHMSNNQSNSDADLSTLYTSPSMPNISLGRPPSNSVVNIIYYNNYNFITYQKKKK